MFIGKRSKFFKATSWLSFSVLLGFLFGYKEKIIIFSLPLFFFSLSLSFSLVSLIFLLPFLPALNLGPEIDLASSRLIICSLFWVFAMGFCWGRRPVWAKNKTAFLIILFCFWSCLSLFYSPVTERTVRKLLVLLTIAPIFFVAYGLIMEKGLLLRKKIVTALGVSGAVVCFFALSFFLLQFLVDSKTLISWCTDRFGPFFWGTTASLAVKNNPSWLVDLSGKDFLRAFLPFPDPHMLSFFLSFSLPAQLFSFFDSKNKKRKAFFLFAVILSVFTEALTFSRGGYLGFLGAIFLAVVILAIQKKAKNLFLFAILAGLLFLGPIGGRLKSSFDLSEGSNQGRLAVWAKAISISKEHPLLGVGLGAFSYEVNSLSEYRDPIYAHNLYLELLAETGIIGIGLFMAILFVAIQGLRRGLFLSNKKEALLSACLLGSFVWFLIHSFFEMPLYSPVILPLFFLLLAFSSLVEKENRERPRATEPKNKKTPLVLLD